ncbi:MAG: hypothetical protein EOO16_20355 [Chitinophagaceae bacterium]|nr:MAG: hypothetical protein EOO16_20355 [Chitinophagaceae bacterium]
MNHRLFLATAGLLLLGSCTSADTRTPVANSTSIRPVELPDPGIAGFHYPESEATLNTWIDNNDSARIIGHAWGLWASLTDTTSQRFNNEQLRVFETWLTTEQMLQAQEGADVAQLQAGSNFARKLQVPHQFEHARNARQRAHLIDPTDSAQILGFVKYNPVAADFTIRNRLKRQATLDSLLAGGAAGVPDFPNASMAVKPVFQVLTKDNLNKDGLYVLKVWNGPPATAVAYAANLWPDSVFVDPTNQRGHGHGGVIGGDGKATPENTYNASDFIHFSLDEATAAHFRGNFKGLRQAKAGDVAILLAMHVTSRETKRWTWQTYWWAPDPDNPPLPSTKRIADSRPEQLKGTPRHYAMSMAYTFLLPNQPFTGGNNSGTSIYSYNPYLEAGFDSSVLSNVPTSVVITNGQAVTNVVGVRSNCMSCHAQANYNQNVATAPNYTGDTYIDMDGKAFRNTLKLDFLWSLTDTLVPDAGKSKTALRH